MDTFNILIGVLILVIVFVIMKHVNIDFYNYPTLNANANGKCANTRFGCCPDGINSKINFYGTNCPPYNAGPGYSTLPPPPPPYTAATTPGGPTPYSHPPVSEPQVYNTAAVAATTPATAQQSVVATTPVTAQQATVATTTPGQPTYQYQSYPVQTHSSYPPQSQTHPSTQPPPQTH